MAASFNAMVGELDVAKREIEDYSRNLERMVAEQTLELRESEANLKTVIRNAKILFRDPNNYDARSEIMWAGTLAHNDLLDTGRIADWGSHDIEHELSGIYDIPHGAGLSTVIPAWMQYVYKENVLKFVQFGQRVFNVEPEYEFSEDAALEAIGQLKGFFKPILGRYFPQHFYILFMIRAFIHKNNSIIDS